MEMSPLEYASFWRRFNAYGIDATIVLLIAWLLDTFVLGHAFAQVPDSLQQLSDAVAALQIGNITPELQSQAQTAILHSFLGGSIIPVDTTLMIIVSAVYNILPVTGAHQATWAKRWLGIRVEMADGRPLTLKESLIRHAVSGVSMVPMGLGYATMFFTRDKLALHDIICNTRVVRVRS